MFKNSFASSSSLGGNLFGKMFSSTFKMVEKEMQRAMEEEAKMPKAERISNQNPNIRSDFQLFINGKRVPIPNNIAGLQIQEPLFRGQISKKNHIQRTAPKISDETLKASKELPRKEAKSKVSRTSDRVIYELETPGLNKIENILINKLENSFEIKAYTENAVFFKTLQVKLPLMQYAIKEGKLFLEFKTQ